MIRNNQEPPAGAVLLAEIRGALTVLAFVTLGALGVGLLQLDAPLVVILCNLRLHAIMV